MSFDLQIFNNHLNIDLAGAKALVEDKERLMYILKDLHEFSSDSIGHIPVIEEEMELTDFELETVLLGIKTKLIFALEALDLKIMLEAFLQEWDFIDQPTSLKPIPYISIMYCPCLKMLERYAETFKTQSEHVGKQQDLSNSIGLLERLLRGTAKVIRDRGLIPSNEAEVQREMYQILLHVFPDAIREFPIPCYFSL